MQHQLWLAPGEHFCQVCWAKPEWADQSPMGGYWNIPRPLAGHNDYALDWHDMQLFSAALWDLDKRVPLARSFSVDIRPNGGWLRRLFYRFRGFQCWMIGRSEAYPGFCYLANLSISKGLVWQRNWMGEDYDKEKGRYRRYLGSYEGANCKLCLDMAQRLLGRELAIKETIRFWLRVNEPKI